MDPSAPRKQPYTLYAADGRVFAANAPGHLIDLGALDRTEGGWRYLLDGNQESGEGLPTPQAALQAVATHLSFLWLDGQFTALPDLSGEAGFDRTTVPRLEIALDELAPGEPVVDASV
jgi:hypothetical protein